ncbi:MAG: hypothetical protein WCT06_02445 [Armatimonadota bacterium]|jgi:hypothetical protein
MRIALGALAGFAIAVALGLTLAPFNISILTTYVSVFMGAYIAGYIARRRSYLAGLITGILAGEFASLAVLTSGSGKHINIYVVLSAIASNALFGTFAGWAGGYLYKVQLLQGKNQD